MSRALPPLPRARALALAAALGAALAACEERAPAAPPVAVAPAPGSSGSALSGHRTSPDAASVAPDPGPGSAGAASLRAYPAIRCAECHNKMHDEWAPSAHATAATGPLYRRMRELAAAAGAAGAAGAGCDACHAPLAKHLPPGDLAAAEGVTCEVCHNIRAVEPRRAGAGFELRLDRVKYGPLCDAKDHYFHRMGCSPLHARGELCAGCHLYYRELPGGGALPVYTEYEEWQDGPYQARECQSCHMPGARAEVADGAGERADVGHHGWLGARGDLRQRALAATATVTAAAAGDRLAVDARVENVAAGHHVPTGSPERRIVVRATALGPDGAVHATAEQAFGRVLVDAAGRPAPFWAAVRVASDDRIPPKQARRARLELAAPPAGELRVEVLWLPIAADLAARLEIRGATEVPLLRATVAIGPVRAGGRPGLPRTIGLQR